MILGKHNLHGLHQMWHVAGGMGVLQGEWLSPHTIWLLLSRILTREMCLLSLLLEVFFRSRQMHKPYSQLGDRQWGSYHFGLPWYTTVWHHSSGCHNGIQWSCDQYWPIRYSISYWLKGQVYRSLNKDGGQYKGFQVQEDASYRVISIIWIIIRKNISRSQ